MESDVRESCLEDHCGIITCVDGTIGAQSNVVSGQVPASCTITSVVVRDVTFEKIHVEATNRQRRVPIVVVEIGRFLGIKALQVSVRSLCD